MQNYNENQKVSESEQWNPKETVEAIQNVSKRITEYSTKVRETMKALRESNVIPELAEAVCHASYAVRDTVGDINETTKELKRRGVIVNTANAVEATWKSTEDSVVIIKQITSDAAKASPHTIKAVRTGIDTVKKESIPNMNKTFKEIKTKVSVT